MKTYLDFEGTEMMRRTRERGGYCNIFS